MSQRNSGYERKPHEQYDTPEWVTHTLVQVLHERYPRLVVWEPAMGAGKMVQALRERSWWTVHGSDIQQCVDFLQAQPADDYNAIITNPPYSRRLSEAFVRRALDLMRPVNGLVAMLLRVDFDSATTRADMFADCPAWSKKIVLRKRIMWFVPPPRPDGKKPAGPSENHAWYVWDWKHQGPPTIVYAP